LQRELEKMLLMLLQHDFAKPLLHLSELNPNYTNYFAEGFVV
jgi:hypothetical protein